MPLPCRHGTTSCLRFISASRSLVGVNMVYPCPILSDLLSQSERANALIPVVCRRCFRPFIEHVDECVPDLIWRYNACQMNPLYKGTFF